MTVLGVAELITDVAVEVHRGVRTGLVRSIRSLASFHAQHCTGSNWFDVVCDMTQFACCTCTRALGAVPLS